MKIDGASNYGWSRSLAARESLSAVPVSINKFPLKKALHYDE